MSDETAVSGPVQEEIVTPVPPTFVDPARRLTHIDLDYPLTYDGRTYSRIVVRRLTTMEVATFVESLREKSETEPDAVVRWPMSFDENGHAIPDVVISALDDDDAVKLDEAIQGFLPRRYRAAPERSSPLATGVSTAPWSATRSAGE